MSVIPIHSPVHQLSLFLHVQLCVLQKQGIKSRHTDCIRAPFCPPTTVSAEPSLRSALDFCRLTTSCDEELKLSEACLLTAGIMADGRMCPNLIATKAKLGDGVGSSRR